MSDQIKDTSVFQFSKENRLQWEPTQNKHVILSEITGFLSVALEKNWVSLKP